MLLTQRSVALCFSQGMEHFDDVGPSVVMASPGMMQSGLSRELFESWCTDHRNGVIVAGYCVEGTLAKVRNNNVTLPFVWHHLGFGIESFSVGNIYSSRLLTCGVLNAVLLNSWHVSS